MWNPGKFSEEIGFWLNRWFFTQLSILCLSRVNLLLGYLPHQLMSESIFNQSHADDVPMLRKTFQDALNNPHQKIQTQTYRLKLENNVKANSYTNVETVFYALSNPSSCQLEYVLAQTKLASLSDISSTALGILGITRSNSTSISLPMTPSPEEISYANSEVLSEKGNSNAFLSSTSNESFGSDNSMEQTSKSYYNYLASPTKANNHNNNNSQLQQQLQQQHSNSVNAPRSNRSQQDSCNYSSGVNSVSDSRLNSAPPSNDFYTGAGQLQSSQYDVSSSRKSDYSLPQKHASFSGGNSSSSNSSSYEYVQNEHAYSNVGSTNSSQQQQTQYANYDGCYSSNQMNQYSQKGTSFPLQQDPVYLPFDDSAYGDSATPASNSYSNNNNSNK